MTKHYDRNIISFDIIKMLFENKNINQYRDGTVFYERSHDSDTDKTTIGIEVGKQLACMTYCDDEEISITFNSDLTIDNIYLDYCHTSLVSCGNFQDKNDLDFNEFKLDVCTNIGYWPFDDELDEHLQVVYSKVIRSSARFKWADFLTNKVEAYVKSGVLTTVSCSLTEEIKLIEPEITDDCLQRIISKVVHPAILARPNAETYHCVQPHQALIVLKYTNNDLIISFEQTEIDIEEEGYGLASIHNWYHSELIQIKGVDYEQG